MMTSATLTAAAALLLISFATVAQQAGKDPTLTEVWEPVPTVVDPGPALAQPLPPPADATVLFDGSGLSAWESAAGGAAGWSVADGALTVKPQAGNIKTRQSFGDCQLHVEWRAPAQVKGEGQGRGNSGIFLLGLYELQVLDSYQNRTYANGQAGSIYKQLIPLANAARPPGQWQSYDVIFTAPRFNEAGRCTTPAYVTVLHNGVLVQNHAALWGPTEYIGLPVYKPHPARLPLQLQDHGDLVSYRNVWIRPL